MFAAVGDSNSVLLLTRASTEVSTENLIYFKMKSRGGGFWSVLAPTQWACSLVEALLGQAGFKSAGYRVSLNSGLFRFPGDT